MNEPECRARCPSQAPPAASALCHLPLFPVTCAGAPWAPGTPERRRWERRPPARVSVCTCTCKTLAQPEPGGDRSCLLAPGTPPGVWPAWRKGQGQEEGNGGSSCQPAPGGSPINTHGPQAGHTHTMGRVALAVLGLTCCLAVVSSAKVSEPLCPTGPDLATGGRPRGGADRGAPGRESQPEREPTPSGVAFLGTFPARSAFPFVQRLRDRCDPMPSSPGFHKRIIVGVGMFHTVQSSERFSAFLMPRP